MDDRRRPPVPEQWELRSWAIHDRLREAREREGRRTAEYLAERAWKAIEPDERKELTNGKITS